MIRSKRDLNVFRHGRGGVYHVRFRTNGREIRRSTGKFHEREARDQAWQIYLHESGQGIGPAPALRRNLSPSLGKICDIYMKGIADYTSIQPASA